MFKITTVCHSLDISMNDENDNQIDDNVDQLYSLFFKKKKKKRQSFRRRIYKKINK